jgi:hypothetical protein
MGKGRVVVQCVSGHEAILLNRSPTFDGYCEGILSLLATNFTRYHRSLNQLTDCTLALASLAPARCPWRRGHIFILHLLEVLLEVPTVEVMGAV